MGPGLQVLSATVAGVYLTPLCGCAGVARPAFPQPLQGPETLPAGLVLTLGWPSGASAGKTPHFPSVPVPPPSLCLSFPRSQGEIPRAWVTQEGEKWPIFLGFRKGGSAVLSFSLSSVSFTSSSPGIFLLPSQATSCPTLLGTSLKKLPPSWARGSSLRFFPLSLGNPPFLSLSLLAHKFPECGLNSRQFSGYT